MEYATEFDYITESLEFQVFKKYYQDCYPATNKGVNSRMLVVGAGVNGLTTAIRLALDGHKVKIVAKEFAPKDPLAPGYVSTVAGALWEYPPALCGRQKDEVSVARSKLWAMTSYHFFHGLSLLPGDHGVTMNETNFYFKYNIEERAVELEKMEDLKELAQGFKRGLQHINKKELNEEELQDIMDCYQIQSPVIDTGKYLLWLHLLALELGVHMQKGDVPAPLKAHEQTLKNKHNVDIIVNCSGLGAQKLVPDQDVFPMRGAFIRVWNDGRDFPVVNTVHAMSHDETNVDSDGEHNQDMLAIVPRGNFLYLGGIAEEDEWDTTKTLQNYKPYREMFERCKRFMPQLERATLVKEAPLLTGLRPGHTTGVKNYVQPGTKIVHSYGHGGSGWSFSLGCANEVLMRANKLSLTIQPDYAFVRSSL